MKLNSDTGVDEPQVVGMVMIGVGDGFDVPDTRGAHSQIGVREAMGRKDRLLKICCKIRGSGSDGA